MTEITDEDMRSMLPLAREYSVVLLHRTAAYDDSAAPVVWEHGRRNFQLRADGVLSIVCPVTDGGALAGVGIFDGTPEQIAAVMDADPGVQAGIFSYEVHPCRGFPGDALP